MVSWSWHCVARTTPYLLILDLDQVFCVDRSSPFVLVALFSSLLVMFGEAVPYFLLKFLFLWSCGLWVDVQDSFRSWHRMVLSWLFPDIHYCMRTLPRVDIRSNRPANSWYVHAGIVLGSHWFFRFARPFADGMLYSISFQFLIFPLFVSIILRWTSFLCRWWYLVGSHAVVQYLDRKSVV